jgi:hypothetical protein
VDDILIHTADVLSNQYWTGRVLARLEEFNLYCHETKCLFEKEEVEFLVLAEGAVKVSPSKVTAITKEELPTTKKGVRCFLGLTNYHQRFIRDYSRIDRPLHDLMKDTKFKWMNECQVYFERLKDALSTAPVLALPVDEGLF